MVPPFEIFRVFNDEEPLWVEAAMTLDDAILRVRQIGGVLPGEYLIHSKKTGVEICLTVPRSPNLRPGFNARSESLAVHHHPRLPRNSET